MFGLALPLLFAVFGSTVYGTEPLDVELADAPFWIPVKGPVGFTPWPRLLSACASISTENGVPGVIVPTGMVSCAVGLNGVHGPNAQPVPTQNRYRAPVPVSFDGSVSVTLTFWASEGPAFLNAKP